MKRYLQVLSLLRRGLVFASVPLIVYGLLVNAQIVPELPVSDLNGIVSRHIRPDRLLEISGLENSSAAHWAVEYVSQYSLAILFLAGAALLYLVSLLVYIVRLLAAGASSLWRRFLALRQSFQRSAGPDLSAAGDEDGLDAGEAVSSLVTLLSLHGIAADPGQIKHRFGGGRIGLDGMLRLAKELGLKARILHTNWERLIHTPLPGIAALKTGGFLLVAKTDGEKALVQASGASKPKLMIREEFEAELGRPAAPGHDTGRPCRSGQAFRSLVVSWGDPEIPPPAFARCWWHRSSCSFSR